MTLPDAPSQEALPRLDEGVLFQSETISISRSIARFGNTSYQIANISSVRVGYEKRFNTTAIALFLIGVAAIGGAYAAQGLSNDIRLIGGGAGTALILGAIVLQAIWPRMEFTLSLRANSGDLHAFKTTDREHALNVKHAIEDAFASRS